MKYFHSPTMTELHTELCDWFINAEKPDFDFINRVDSQIHNVVAEADSMVWDQDLKNFWLTKVRWNTLVKQYLDLNAVEAWINKCAAMRKRGRGVALLRTKEVAVRGGQGNSSVTRKWGSCLISISYRARPQPQIVLHSRTSYLGYLAVLDMTVPYVLAKYLSEAINIPLENMSFVWFNECMQWHSFKSIAYMLNHPDLDERAAFRTLLGAPEDELAEEDLEEMAKYPIQWGTRKWLQKLIVEDANNISYGDMKYNTYRRVRRRYHTEIIGPNYGKQFEGLYYPSAHSIKNDPRMMKAYPPLPSRSLNTLDLTSIGWPLNPSQIITSEDFDDEEEDDDEE